MLYFWLCLSAESPILTLTWLELPTVHCANCVHLQTLFEDNVVLQTRPMMCPLHFAQVWVKRQWFLSIVVWLSHEHIRLTSLFLLQTSSSPESLSSVRGSHIHPRFHCLFTPVPKTLELIILSNVSLTHPCFCSSTLMNFDQILDDFRSLLNCPFCIQFGLFNLMKNNLLSTYSCVRSYSIVVSKTDLFL